jgi:uncharacterized protein YndB with AHSA1/START domain
MQSWKSMLGGAAVAFVLIGGARCAVADQSATGFELRETAHIAAAPDKVYAALIQPAKWWSSDHTFSGSAANMTMDAKAGGCWCESIPGGGSVLHMTVVMASPGKALRLRGALGPFQGTGMEGAMAFVLKADAGGATDLTMTYDIGGYMKGGFGPLPAGADGVLAEQMARLKAFVEAGSPEKKG